MTVGIICLDGLDHRLASEYDIFDPVPATHQPLVNDLEGENPLFTPRVWTSLMAGIDQREVTGWLPEHKWETATQDFTFIWDKVQATAVLNLNLHTNYRHENACIPEGWTPAHGDFSQMRGSTLAMADFWNDTLKAKQPPLQIGYWRLPDAYGHRAAQAGWEDHHSVYSWLRNRFWDVIDLPDQWMVLSDHGFALNPSECDHDNGRQAHTKHGCVAATWDLPDRSMSAFIPTWHDMLITKVRAATLDSLGY